MESKMLTLTLVFVSLWSSCISAASNETWIFQPVGRINVTPQPRNQTWIMQPKWTLQPRKRTTGVPCGSHTLSPGQTVTIESEGYPDLYPRNYRCKWNFQGSSTDSKITIACDDFVLRACRHSLLRITGGGLFAKYCNNQPPFEETSSNNFMRVLFRTRSSFRRKKGFSCRVTASEVEDTTTTSPPTTSSSTTTSTTTTTRSTTPLIAASTTAPTATGECKPCGTVNRVTRIVGGFETEVNEYPWQVALVYAGTNDVFCGGSLMNDLTVVTAAHCVAFIFDENLTVDVLLGAHDLDSPPATQQRIPVANAGYHSGYDSNTYDHNIGVLWLENAAELNDNVKPACLPDPSKDYSEYLGVTSGWGALSEGGSQPTILNEVDVPVISNTDCDGYYGGGITSNMVCAGYEEGGKDACQGDSGGPLVVEDNGSWVLVGVTSWGYGCARPGYPGVYARVSEYVSILQSVISDGSNDLCNGQTGGPAATTEATTVAKTTIKTTPPTTASCLCGRRNPITKIVGGTETTTHEYPWQVGLTSVTGTRPWCGGSIISDEWILTAAHCVNGDDPSSLTVIVGEHNWQTTTETSSTQRKEVAQIVVHPSYDSGNQDNDIALLRLSSPVAFPSDNKIAPVCLPTTADDYDDVDAIVTGWGTLSSGGSQPSTLNEVTVPTMPNSQCQQSYGTGAITSNMICAGLEDGGKDSCQGDSGGPMITGANAANTFYEQIGVVSWGYGCAYAGYPGVYARVTSYLSWIDGYISGSVICARP